MRLSRNQPLLMGALIAVLLGTAWLFSRVLEMRFESGTVYPPYSTLRADPLGSKALYESLDRLPGMEVRQNFRSLEKLHGKVGETLVLLDLKPSTWVDGLVIKGKDLQRYAVEGGRVVMTLDGAGMGMARIGEEARQQRLEREKERQRKARKDKDKDGKEISDEDLKNLGLELPDSLAKVTGLEVSGGKFMLTSKGGKPLKKEEGLKLDDAKLPLWYSGTSLEVDEKVKADWKVLATVNGDPVMVEKSAGRGSMVVCTDSYFVSNEALLKEPAPEFLLWLMGGNSSTVIFDETHLGTKESPGIMALARRFRLHGFFVGGLLLFGLFVWQASSSLVPQRGSDRGDGSVSGQGATAGLVSLLRRGVSRRQLLSKCFEAWDKGALVKSPAMQRRMEEARVLLTQQAGERMSRGALRKGYAQLSAVLKSRAG
ncbi:DUF4350 domain-containing protein [Phragmitibacter flavus]|nr:DUF4350 domain-containing protein [Phragmitibacter flavus]